MERKKKVVIVGAGMAGMSAARWLITNDIYNKIDVSILEGRSRIGGRIHTINVGSGDVISIPVDMGAAWIHEHDTMCNPISILAKTLGTKVQVSDGDGVVMNHTGKPMNERSAVKIWEKTEETMETAVGKLHRQLGRTSAPNGQSFQAFIQQKLGMPPTSSSFNDLSGANSQIADVSKLNIQHHYLSELEFQLGTSLEHASPYGVDTDWLYGMNTSEADANRMPDDEKDDYVPLVGLSVLLQGVHSGEATKNNHMSCTQEQGNRKCLSDEELGSQHELSRPVPVSLGAAVTHIDTSGEKGADGYPCSLTVSSANPGNASSGIENDSVHLMGCDLIIVTVPLGVLKSPLLQFNPALSPRKQMAIKTCGFGQGVMKVVMEFDSVFWPANAEFINCTPLLGGSSNEARSCSRVGGDGGEIPSTYDDSMRGLLYSFWNLHMVHSKGKGKAGGNTAAVLVGFVLGDESCKLVAGMSEAQLRDLIIRRCRLIAATNASDPLPADCTFTPRSVTRTSWNEDRFAQGCYSYVPRGMHGMEHWEELGRAENARLYFAGEHTCTSAQTRSSVRGAFLSGVRVAESVVHQLNKDAIGTDVPHEVCTPGVNAFNSRW